MPIPTGRIAAALASALCAATPAAAAAIDGLRPHRAIYDVSLVEASERSGMRAMEGSIVYEFGGSACEGFTSKFRFVLSAQTTRREFTSDERTSTFEAGDGSSLSFTN